MGTVGLSALNVRPDFAVTDAEDNGLVNAIPCCEALAAQRRAQYRPDAFFSQFGVRIRRTPKAVRCLKASPVCMEVVLCGRHPLKVAGVVVQLVPVLMVGTLSLGWLAMEGHSNETVNIEGARPIANDGVSYPGDHRGLHAPPSSHEACVRDLQIREAGNCSPYWG